MPSKKGQVVLFHYGASGDSGNIVEDRPGGESNSYLHGPGENH